MLRNNHSMMIVSIPDVVVVEAVHVDPKLASVHVDVGDKQRRNVKSTILATVS